MGDEIEVCFHVPWGHVSIVLLTYIFDTIQRIDFVNVRETSITEDLKDNYRVLWVFVRVNNVFMAITFIKNMWVIDVCPFEILFIRALGNQGDCTLPCYLQGSQNWVKPVFHQLWNWFILCVN